MFRNSLDLPCFVLKLKCIHVLGAEGEHLQQDERDVGAPPQALALRDPGLRLPLPSHRRDDQAVQRQHQDGRGGWAPG